MASVASRPQGVPAEVLWTRESAKARARLYPSTFLYTAYSLLILAVTLGGAHPAQAVAYFGGGVLVWTALEYFVHRWILHGHFPDGAGVLQHFLHARFDPLHWEHHARPWDGEHINGRIRDTLPFSIGLAVVSAFFPVHTLPVLMAGLFQSYVVEEWVHHSVHFYQFRNPYFRYIKRHHLYHHSPIGSAVGYGLTSGMWDIVGRTRIPPEMRRALYRAGLRAVRRPPDDRGATGGSGQIDQRGCWSSCSR
jgi:sterol desaturase/sphingolipid hydroxylase (fatty acid hydroxylase superfamily)